MICKFWEEKKCKFQIRTERMVGAWGLDIYVTGFIGKDFVGYVKM